MTTSAPNCIFCSVRTLLSSFLSISSIFLIMSYYMGHKSHILCIKYDTKQYARFYISIYIYIYIKSFCLHNICVMLCKCKTVTWMQCKSLWIKTSAKCINVNVNVCILCIYLLCMYKYKHMHVYKKNMFVYIFNIFIYKIKYKNMNI